MDFTNLNFEVTLKSYFESKSNQTYFYIYFTFCAKLSYFTFLLFTFTSTKSYFAQPWCFLSISSLVKKSRKLTLKAHFLRYEIVISSFENVIFFHSKLPADTLKKRNLPKIITNTLFLFKSTYCQKFLLPEFILFVILDIAKKLCSAIKST